MTTLYWGAVFNSVNVWDRTAGSYGTFLKKIMLHEAGHSMGLNEPNAETDGQSVMNSYDGTNDAGGNMASAVQQCDDIVINTIPQYKCKVGQGGDPDCYYVNGSNGVAANYYLYPNDGCEGGFFDSAGCCVGTSPILIDVLGNGYDLTGINNPVSFDFVGAGTPLSVSWTAAGCDDAFLVLDRNGNGTIDNGAELFGNLAAQPPSGQRNGFIALAEYDKSENGGNNDGVINRADPIFASLRLWQDTNHDGISQSDELHRLPLLGVYAISLDYAVSQRIDQYGNRYRYRARVFDRSGHACRWAWDVFFVRNQ